MASNGKINPDVQEEGTETVTRVLVINTGGTIGMKGSEQGYIPIPHFLEETVGNLSVLNDSKYLASYLRATNEEQGFITPLIRTSNGISRRVFYQFLEYTPLLDSSCMDMSSWVRIARDIGEAYKSYDGFLVVHGTDTMTYTASALSFMLENLGKTVVITGAQLPLEAMNSDGISNFSGALTIAGCYVIPEVTVYFSDKLYRGNRTAKTTAFSFDAFASPNYPALLELGAGVIERKQLYHRPVEIKRFGINSSMDPNVCVIRLFPGITAHALRAFLSPPTRGAVLQTYGAGNAPDDRPELLEPFKEASARGCIIVNVTQCQHGNVTASYRTGKMLYDAGVIPGADMTVECALTKLAYVIAQVGRVDVATHCDSTFRRLTKDCDEQRGLATVDRVVQSVLAERPVYLVIAHQPPHGYKACFSSFFDRILQCIIVLHVQHVWTLIFAGAVRYPPPYYAMPLQELPFDQAKRLMQKNLRGELSVVATEAASTKSGFLRQLANAMGSFEDYDRIRESLQPVMFCSAAKAGDVDWLKQLMKDGMDCNACDYDGRTPLHLAAGEGHLEAVRYLLQAGAHVHAKDRFGWTPLRDALNSRNTEVIKLLRTAGAHLGLPPHEEAAALAAVLVLSPHLLPAWLSAGADANSRDYDGRTPLHVAAANGVTTATEQLLSAGADVHIRDNHGETPYSSALLRGQKATAALIAARAAQDATGSATNGGAHPAPVNGHGPFPSAAHILSPGSDGRTVPGHPAHPKSLSAIGNLQLRSKMGRRLSEFVSPSASRRESDSTSTSSQPEEDPDRLSVGRLSLSGGMLERPRQRRQSTPNLSLSLDSGLPGRITSEGGSAASKQALAGHAKDTSAILAAAQRAVRHAASRLPARSPDPARVQDATTSPLSAKNVTIGRYAHEGSSSVLSSRRESDSIAEQEEGAEGGAHSAKDTTNHVHSNEQAEDDQAEAEEQEEYASPLPERTSRAGSSRVSFDASSKLRRLSTKDTTMV
eukprot:TRINITY_DN9788_c0_g1_i5.p1 TRINITY_DN9788_c0_g1~~TRINITY_DN9788_c0_g1_i5.p1  ORF type:complete len:993 (+),score=211.50 TRINITY_DN9788_c0_g1_i5:183-3161(+)